MSLTVTTGELGKTDLPCLDDEQPKRNIRKEKELPIKVIRQLQYRSEQFIKQISAGAENL